MQSKSLDDGFMFETYLIRIEDTYKSVDADMFQQGYARLYVGYLYIKYAYILYRATLYRRVEIRPGHCVQVP